MYLTRKEKLEKIATRGRALSESQCASAWRDLMSSFECLSAPEFPRTPKFRDLVNALVAAYAKSEQGTGRGDGYLSRNNVTTAAGVQKINVTRDLDSIPGWQPQKLNVT